MNREDRGSREIARRFVARFHHTIHSSVSALLPGGAQFHSGYPNSKSPRFLLQVTKRETTDSIVVPAVPPVSFPTSSGVDEFTRRAA